MSEAPPSESPAPPADSVAFVNAWNGWQRTDAARAAGRAPSAIPPPVDSELFVAAWDQPLIAAVEPVAEPDPPARPGRRARGIVRELLQTAAVAVLVFAITQTAVQGREVEGPSMEPSYHPHQKVLVNRLVYARPGWTRLFGWLPAPTLSGGTSFLISAPAYGDVIVFDPPFASRADLIKRVIGRPGDRVTITRDGVFINGQLINEPYVNGYGVRAATVCSGRWCDYTLKADEFFVMGDNRGDSSDSRSWGPVRADRIVGKAWLIYRPFSDFGFAP